MKRIRNRGMSLELQRFTEIVSYHDTFSNDKRIVSRSFDDKLTIQHLYIRNEF